MVMVVVCLVGLKFIAWELHSLVLNMDIGLDSFSGWILG